MPENSSHWTNWIASLPANQIREVREKIIKECDISKDTFYKWRRQYTKVPKLAQEKIAEIAGLELDFTFTQLDAPRSVAVCRQTEVHQFAFNLR